MTKRRWIIAIVALILVLGAGVAAAGYVVWQNRHPGTIRGSASTEFETTAEPGATTRPETAVREIPWPTYGYDEQRTRYAPPFDHRPPYRQVWKRGLGTLAEFPPVLAYGRNVRAGSLGKRKTFADIGQSLAKFFALEPMAYGSDFLL